jgi:hypothetical protein
MMPDFDAIEPRKASVKNLAAKINPFPDRTLRASTAGRPLPDGHLPPRAARPACAARFVGSRRSAVSYAARARSPFPVA